MELMKYVTRRFQYSLLTSLFAVAIVSIVIHLVVSIARCSEQSLATTIAKDGFLVESHTDCPDGMVGMLGIRCTWIESIRTLPPSFPPGSNPSLVQIEGTKTLQALTQCSKLINLDLRQSDVRSDSILECKSLLNLRTLSLSGCPNIDGRGLDEISKSSRLQRLSVLDSALADESIEVLSRLKDLRVLSVGGQLEGDFCSGFANNSSLLMLCILSSKLVPEKLMPLGTTSLENLVVSMKPGSIPIESLPKTLKGLDVFWDAPLDDSDRKWMDAVHARFGGAIVRIYESDDLPLVLGPH